MARKHMNHGVNNQKACLCREKFGCAQRVGFLSSIPRPPVSFLLPSEQEDAKHTTHSGCLYIHIYVPTFGFIFLTFLKPFWIFYIFPSTFFSTKVCIYPFPPEVKLIATFWPECNLYQSVYICIFVYIYVLLFLSEIAIVWQIGEKGIILTPDWHNG